MPLSEIKPILEPRVSCYCSVGKNHLMAIAFYQVVASS